MTEEWRAVADTPYEVSSHGRVRRGGRVLRTCTTRTGYLLVKLSIRGKAGNKLVHRLVAEAFHGIPAGCEVNHIDGVKANNAASNLESVTPSENMRHAHRLGLHKSPQPILDYHGTHWTTRNPARVRGTANNRAKLTDDQVREIRARYRPRVVPIPLLAREYGVAQSLIHRIIRRQAWSHL